MSGRVLIANGKMTIQSPDGRTPFNSDDGLFHTINQLSGALNLNALIFNGGTNYDLTTDFLLGTCNGACTDVIGSVKFSGGGVVLSGAGGLLGSAGVVSNVWITVMGGSAVVLYQDGHGSLGSSPDPNGAMHQFIYYYFYISGGGVYLRRRAFCSKSSGGSITVNGHTITYKLKTGLFT